MNRVVLRKGILVLGAASFTLVLAEMLLRVFVAPVRSGWGWAESPRRELTMARDDPANQLGLRGRSIEYGGDDFVVVLVGDSQVEAATSAPTRMPERLLEKYLTPAIGRPVKVFSIAASGWGQDQQLLGLEEYYARFRADLVLVWATPMNDFWENAFPDRSHSDIAGPLKPTYLLTSSTLEGPFYAAGAYYLHSVLLQLATGSASRYLRGESLEQHILDRWVTSLPPAHNEKASEPGRVCTGTTETTQAEFYQKIFKHGDEVFTLVTDEDFLNSRSVFSPYVTPRSPRDEYLVEISRRLFERLAESAASHGSRFHVFYPMREDLDVRADRQVRCVRPATQADGVYHVRLGYLPLLEAVVPQGRLLPFELSGGYELSVSEDDRHLNDIGNDRAMQRLAALLL